MGTGTRPRIDRYFSLSVTFAVPGERSETKYHASDHESMDGAMDRLESLRRSRLIAEAIIWREAASVGEDRCVLLDSVEVYRESAVQGVA